MKHEPDEFIPTRRSLLSRLKDWDDQESWKEFFDTYWKLIYNTAVKAGLSDAEAQDVVQETILCVAKQMRKFKYDPAVGSFKGWLLHTTRWRIRDHISRVRGKETAPAHPELAADSPRATTLERIPDPDSPGFEAIWDEEWRKNLLDAAIQRAKHRIRPDQYQIFELHVLKEWPALKVSRTLGINVAQVYLAKHRVSKLIKIELERLETQMI